MYEEVTYDMILRRMLDRVSDKLDKRESSLIWDSHSAAAIELQILYIELDTIIRNSYGDTASREFLMLLCKDRGIIPEGATKAILKGEFLPATIDVVGRRFNIGDYNYQVKEKISPGIYMVECESAGEIGNQYLGQMVPIENIPGLMSAELSEVLIPGEDEEDTEVLRQRYFNSFRQQAFGGNQADYLEKVNAIPGVGAAKITRIWNHDIRPAEMIPTAEVTEWFTGIRPTLEGAAKEWLSLLYQAAKDRKLTTGGCVLVTIVNSSDYGAGSDILIKTVQDAMDPAGSSGEGAGLAPIGHVVMVRSAEELPVDIELKLVFENGYSWSNRYEAIREAVREYFLELRRTWADNSHLIVRVSQLETRILALKGIIDVENTRLNGKAENLILGTWQIPVTGGVTDGKGS